MEKIHTRNIVISNTPTNQAIYRCEFRELAETKNFVGQIDVLNLSMYIREYSDHEEIEARRIHPVYSVQNNYTTYFSKLNNLGNYNTFNPLRCSEVRIYAPQNYVQSDMLIIVSTYINSRYVQLFGGLYSECKFNSYQVIKDNQNTYMEYIYFYISTELVENLPYNSISVYLVPYTDLVNGVYQVHDELVPDGVTFETNHYLNLSANFKIVDGIAGIYIKSNMTAKEFLDYYKNLYYDNVWTEDDYYTCTIELYDNTLFKNEHLLWKHTINEKVSQDPHDTLDKLYYINSDDKESLLINNFYPFNFENNDLKFFFNKTLNKKLKITSGEQAEWLSEYYSTVSDSEDDIAYFGEDNVGRDYFTLSWSYIPDIIYGHAYINYTCSNRVGQTDVRKFYTNRFVITRDHLRYIINKPVYAKIPDSSFESYKKTMLNINITNVIEEKIPDKVLLAQNSNLIYKPVFFKTQPLSSLELVPGVTQRVGLNLQEYETKVSAFRLKIGAQVFIETERTDQYVIFKVDANMLEGIETQYYILDQDALYITSGKLYFT